MNILVRPETLLSKVSGQTHLHVLQMCSLLCFLGQNCLHMFLKWIYNIARGTTLVLCLCFVYWKLIVLSETWFEQQSSNYLKRDANNTRIVPLRGDKHKTSIHLNAYEKELSCNITNSVSTFF